MNTAVHEPPASPEPSASPDPHSTPESIHFTDVPVVHAADVMHDTCSAQRPHHLSVRMHLLAAASYYTAATRQKLYLHIPKVEQLDTPDPAAGVLALARACTSMTIERIRARHAEDQEAYEHLNKVCAHLDEALRLILIDLIKFPHAPLVPLAPPGSDQ